MVANQTLTPNTQITQENVDCGCVYCADLGAPELCRGYDRPALSPPAEGVRDEYRQAVRDVNNMRDDGTIKPPYTPTPAPVDWQRVGPQYEAALKRIAHPQYGLGFNKLRGIARAALAAAQPGEGS